MDPQHPHPKPKPNPHPPQAPLIMRNRSSSHRELLILPSPLTRVIQQSSPTHTNHPNLDMDSNQIILPHTTKDKARVGPLPRIHIHNKDKDKKGIIPVHSRDTHIHHSNQLRPLRCTRRLNKGIMDISTGIFWCIAKAHTVPPPRTTQQRTDVVSRILDGEVAKIAVSLTIWPIQRTQIHRHKLMTPGAVVKTSSPQEPWCSVFFFVFPRLDVVDFRWPLFLFRRCQRSAISSPVSLVINLEIP